VAVESTREASKRFFRTRASVVRTNPTTTKMVVSGRDASRVTGSIMSHEQASGGPELLIVTFLFIYIYGESRDYFGGLTEYSGIDVAILFRPSGSDVSAVSARNRSFSHSGHRPRIAPRGSAFLALETLLKRAQSGLQSPPQLPPEADN